MAQMKKDSSLSMVNEVELRDGGILLVAKSEIDQREKEDKGAIPVGVEIFFLDKQGKPLKLDRDLIGFVKECLKQCQGKKELKLKGEDVKFYRPSYKNEKCVVPVMDDNGLAACKALQGCIRKNLESRELEDVGVSLAYDR